jgi:hypothetical protein
VLSTTEERKKMTTAKANLLRTLMVLDVCCQVHAHNSLI